MFRALNIPVILGTTRQGRLSANVAKLVSEELSKRSTVETELIDIGTLPLRTDDSGEATKDSAFASKMERQMDS